MIDFDDPYGLRRWNREAHARNKADREARALRLAPEVVAQWTALVRRTAPHVGNGRRPCDYQPWIGALRVAGQEPAFVRLPGSDAGDY